MKGEKGSRVRARFGAHGGGIFGCQVFSAAEWVLAVVDGVAQFLQHHVQRSVLGQFHHEHTGLHPDVARVWLT